MAVVTRTRALVPQLLRDDREFRQFFGGQAVSLVGDQISMLAIPLVAVLALDASAAQMGYLGAALLLPNLISLHAGAWVDKRGRRRQLMLVTDVLRGAVLATVPLAYAFDALTMAQLYAVSLALGTLTVFFMVSHSTLFVSLVKRDDYVEANSLLHGSRAFSYVAGPPLAGMIVQIASAPIALVVDALTYLVSALTLGRIHPVEPATETAEGGHLMAGARYIWRHPVIRSELASTAWINFFNFIFWAIFVLYATRELDVSPGLLGIVLGGGAVGGILGASVAGRVGRRIGIGPMLALGCVIFTAPLVCVPLAGGSEIVILALLFAAEFGAGFGVMLLDIAAGSINAAIVPHRLRARVSGAFMVVNYGVRPAGALAGGLLGTWIGLHATMWIATVGAVFGVLFLLPSPIMRMRDLPEEPEEID